MSLGVSIDEVWNQPMILNKPKPTKNSKYSVPIGNSHQSNERMSVNMQRQRDNSPQHTSFPATFNKLEGHSQIIQGGMSSPPPRMSANVMQGYNSVPISTPDLKRNSQEIPFLREKLTQQTNTVTDCQKEVAYLKAMVHNLTQELKLSYYEKKKKQSNRCNGNSWMNIFCSGLYLILLILIIYLLIKLLNKVDKIGTSPLNL